MFRLIKQEITGEGFSIKEKLLCLLSKINTACVVTAVHYGPLSQDPQEQEKYTNQYNRPINEMEFLEWISLSGKIGRMLGLSKELNKYSIVHNKAVLINLRGKLHCVLICATYFFT